MSFLKKHSKIYSPVDHCVFLCATKSSPAVRTTRWYSVQWTDDMVIWILTKPWQNFFSGSWAKRHQKVFMCIEHQNVSVKNSYARLSYIWKKLTMVGGKQRD